MISKKRGLYVFLLILMCSLVSAAYFQDYGYDYGGSSSGGYSGGFYSGFDFGDVFKFSFFEFYQNYGYIIDSVIFLLVFISIGKATLGERFKSGGQSLFIGLGIFLSVALLIWEERTGFYLLLEFGPVALAFFVIILIIWMFTFFHGMEVGGLYAAAFAYMIFFFVFGYFVDNPSYQWVKDFLNTWSFTGIMMTIMHAVFVIAIVILLFGLVKLFLFTKRRISGTP